MNKILTFTLAFIFILKIGYSQDKTAVKYAAFIDSVELKNTLRILASDEFEGRESGKDGEEKTVEYLSKYLKDQGVKPSKDGYFQNIGAKYKNKGNKRFMFDDFNYDEDFSYSNISTEDSIIKASEIIFAGYGAYSSTYNDFKGFDLKDKVVMILKGEPANKFGLSYVSSAKRTYLDDNEPKAILKVTNSFSRYSNYNTNQLIIGKEYKYNSNSNFPEIEINEILANKILESTGKTVKQIMYEIELSGNSPSAIINKPIDIAANYTFNDAKVKNVIGFVEGTDLKDEYIVVLAHHDHIGSNYNDDIYNGADDNASGVSASLEMARVFAKAKKEGKGPRRSIIFIYPGAEEKGLYGSKYYVENPIYPLKNTVACINIDMVGRISKDYNGKTNNYIYVVSDDKKSGNLVDVVKNANNISTKMELDFSITSPNNDSDRFFSRSDHYSFAQKNIYSIMFTSGEHEDYHRITDDMEKIDFNALWKRTNLIFHTIWDLANSNNKPKKHEEVEEEAIETEILMSSSY